MRQESPRKMLRALIEKPCGIKGCKNHGVISKSVEGKVEIRCISHLTYNPVRSSQQERIRLLRAIGLGE